MAEIFLWACGLYLVCILWLWNKDRLEEIEKSERNKRDSEWAKLHPLPEHVIQSKYVSCTKCVDIPRSCTDLAPGVEEFETRD